MIGWNGGVNPALRHLAMKVAVGFCAMVLAPSPAFAGERYVCTFTTECVATSPCDPNVNHTVELIAAGRGWDMIIEGQEPVEFIELPSSGDVERHMVAIDIDPTTGGTSMLSIGSDGMAVLSIHGNFPSLGAVTHLGTCTTGDG